ncbi:MAG: hypothetical protein IJU23_12370 [Proteobacteria bacterium]|nr:hypothetical protein [Pseudomonadota bacterium]
MKRKLIAALLMTFLTGLCLSGCGKMGPESKSGDDRDRLGAMEIKLDDLVLDFVTCIDGDKTDWKYFSVPAETRIAVTFAFDQPQAMGTVVIVKPTGEEMYKLPFRPGARNIQEFDAVNGHYYLKIYCDAYESEYTIEVSIPH